MKIKYKNQIIIDTNTLHLSKIKKNSRIKNKRLIKEIMKGNKIHNKMENIIKCSPLEKEKT